MLKEFKKFALRGNMIDLAVGMIIGSAFTGIVNSLVNDMIMPVVSIFTGKVIFQTGFSRWTAILMRPWRQRRLPEPLRLIMARSFLTSSIL